MRPANVLDIEQVLERLPEALVADRGIFASALKAPQTRLQHGDLPTWLSALSRLPTVAPHPEVDLRQPAVTASIPAAAAPGALRDTLQQLSPWRKGPWQFGPIGIDSEWRSDLKWNRFADRLGPLDGERILDVGGGNGYFAYRLAGLGATAVLNIDPTLLFYCQFLAAQHFLQVPSVGMLPVTLEALPRHTPYDTVLSMGVLYHRRSPIHHLRRLANQLRSRGRLVLETLIIDDGDKTLLVPDDRYARMRNVWFIPNEAMLKTWLRRTGFGDIDTVDVTATGTDEQRATPWMTFESLREALHPDDPTRTIEGLPAPKRIVLLAHKH